MSPRKRLYFNVGSLSCCSRSIYGRCCVWQAIKVIHLESTILYPCRHHALQLTICHAHLGPLQAYILIHLSLSNWAIQHTVINNELADRYFHVGYLSWVIYLCSALCTLKPKKPKKNSKKPRFFSSPGPVLCVTEYRQCRNTKRHSSGTGSAEQLGQLISGFEVGVAHF